MDLHYAERDAQQFIEFLESKKSGTNWIIKPLIGQEATTVALNNLVDDVFEEAGPQDLIFFYFSGHGRAHPTRHKEVYLLTYDFEPTYKRAGFDYGVLKNLISDTAAKHVIAFIDACHSGTIGFTGKGKPEAQFNQDVFGEEIAKMGENKVLFTSGRGREPSWEDTETKLGVFTRYLLEGLNGSAPDHRNPQFVDLGELADFVKRKVKAHTQNDKNMYTQSPQIYGKDGLLLENFPLALRN